MLSLFTCTCLSISKNTSIIALKSIQKNICSKTVINFLLTYNVDHSSNTEINYPISSCQQTSTIHSYKQSPNEQTNKQTNKDIKKQTNAKAWLKFLPREKVMISSGKLANNSWKNLYLTSQLTCMGLISGHSLYCLFRVTVRLTDHK